MALIVNNNIPALQTYNAVTTTTNALQKSIQKLSSGLRINNAADDAAGLAISEKMRAQIRGLDRAVSNSQDGISMIQTAESALSETHSILQRMRELSVQAANDTLTQQDRGYIQLEIDELREEITRIGNTTQFNKKKLLDGSAAVLWSSDKTTTKAVINGGLRNIDTYGQKNSLEGNFKISIDATPGDAEVKKTDIFKIKHGVTSVEYSKKNLIGSISGTSLEAGHYRISATSATAVAATPSYIDGTDSFATKATADSIFSAAASLTKAMSGDVLVEILKRDASGTTVKITGNFVDEFGEAISDMKTFTVTAGETTLTGNFGGLTFSGATLNSSNIEVGSKAIFHLIGKGTVTAATGGSIKINYESYEQSPTAITFPGATTPTRTYNFLNSSVAGKTITIAQFYIDKDTKSVSQGAITFTLSNSYTGSAAGTGGAGEALALANKDTYTTVDEDLAVFSTAKVGSVASGTDKLYDLEKFWDAQGRFMLVDPQTITLTQGDGRSTTITLYANDTLNDVADKLNEAIVKGLGQGEYVGGLTSKFVNYTGAAIGGGSLESTPGTIVIRSALPGASGKISFAGDEELINAFSLNVIQQSKETDYTVTITDAHSGATVLENERITGNRLIGKLNANVDVEFALNSGFGEASWDDAKGTFTFSDPTTSTTFLHLADNTTVFQIGANEGEDMGINIGDMRSDALGLNTVLVTDRTSAARSITIIDSAIDKVSTQRAKLGAYQNRLEHTITNLTVAGENLTAAESRIRDTDMAKEMMNFTKLQIMLQAGTSMLAQSNSLPQNVLSLLR